MDEKSDGRFKNKPAESEQLRRVNQQLEAANQQLRAAKEELLKSRQRYQAAFDGVNEAIAVYAPLEDGKDFVLKNLNVSAERTEGVKRENVLSKYVTELFPRVQETGLFDVFRNVWESGKAKKFLEAICREQQIIAWRENYIFKSSTGEIVNVFEDVTESKRAEKKLAEEHNLLRLLIDSMPDYIYVKNTNSEFVVGNTALANGVGLDNPEGLLGNTDYDFFPRELASKYYKDEQDVIKSSEPLVNREELVVDRQGRKKWFLTTKVPWRDRGGNKLGIIGIGRDITERKDAEERLKAVNQQLAASEQQLRSANQQLEATHQQLKVEEQQLRVASQQLKAANQNLRESEEKFRSMFELSPFSMVLLDLEGSIRDCNQQFVKFHATKKGPEAQIGRNISEFFPPEQRPLLFGVIERTIKEKKSIIGPVEYIMSREDGSTFPAEGFSIVMLDSTGSPEAVLGLASDITDRKKAEKELQESEQEKTLILNSSSEIINYSDTNFKVKWINKTGAESVEKKPEDLIGRRCYEIWAGRNKPCDGCPVEKVIRTGEVQRAEMATPDGRMWLVRGAPVRDDNSNIIGIVEVTLDITERKKAEQELRDSRNMLQTVLDTIPAAVFWKDRDSIYLGGNRPFLKAVGLKSSEEVVGKSDYDFPWKREQADSFREYDRRVMESGIPEYDIIEPYLRADSTHAWAKTNKVPLRDTEGNVVGILGTYEDITERKRAEQALKESEERYRELANSITDVFFAMDENLRYTYWNKASEKLTGIKAKGAIGKSIFEVFLDNEDTRRAVAVYQEVLNTQKSISFVNEYRLGDKNFVFGINAYPTKNGISVFVKDITERKSAEQALQEAHDELEKRVEERTAQLLEANIQLQKETAERMRKEEMLRESEKLAAVGSLAAKIAHEINNPLAGIKNSFLLIKDSVPDSHPYYKYVGLIEKEIERVSDIVRQMYDLYGPVQAQIRDFRLSEAVVDVVALLKVASEEHKVDMNIDIDNNIFVRLPDGLLRQVLFNIIQNAIEASQPHSIVRVTARICEDVLSMKVIDSGVGIAEDICEKIFEPFFTSKRDSTKRGLGLGLSVCKNIVDAIGGEVTVQSRVGKGTTFTIIIPLRDENAESKNG